MQQLPNGEYHPMGYFSRALLPSEKNYFVTEIEVLGVVWVITHLRAYLEGMDIVVLCDTRALMSLLMTNSPNQRIYRWRLRFSEFTYEIRHKPGSEHRVADSLSRLPTTGLDTSHIDHELPLVAVTTRCATALTGREGRSPPEGRIPLSELLQQQAKDTMFQARRTEWDSVPPPDPKWARIVFFFEDKDGVICRRFYLGGNTQTVIPESLR